MQNNYLADSYLFIDSQTLFEKYCPTIFSTQVVGIDTEFDRTRTFYPIMSLMQISSNKNYVIDLMRVDILSAKKYLESNNIFKLMHSCNEDVEGVFVGCGIKICNIIDTQIVAQSLGHKNLGYKSLLKNLLNIDVNKEERMSNWLARPLSEKQLEYSYHDTYFLFQLYNSLRKNADINQYVADVDFCKPHIFDIHRMHHTGKELLHKFKYKHLVSQNRDIAEIVLTCREELAMKHNVIRRLVASDEIALKVIHKLQETNNSDSVNFKNPKAQAFKNYCFSKIYDTN